MTLNRIIESGEYTGDLIAKSLDVGWQPALVIVANNKTTGPQAQRNVHWKTDTMTSDTYQLIGGTASSVLTNGLTLTSLGYDLGTGAEVNNSGVLYRYTQFRAGPWIDTGTYTGGGGTQAIALGRQPVAVMIGQLDGTVRWFFKTDTMATTNCSRMEGSVAQVAAVTIQSTGFEVTGEADNNTQAYHYAAFYDVVGSTRHWQVGTYSGVDASDISISMGSQPQYGLITRHNAGDLLMFKSDAIPSGEHASLGSSYTYDTSAPFSLVADGFDLNGTKFNQNGSDYHWLAGMR